MVPPDKVESLGKFPAKSARCNAVARPRTGRPGHSSARSHALRRAALPPRSSRSLVGDPSRARALPRLLRRTGRARRAACALERVRLADVPCAGPNENYRAARGHCGEYTRVLTATLCTIADGFDRLVPIVASATVSPRLAESNRSDDDGVALLEEYHRRRVPTFDDFDEFGAGDFANANAREPLHAAYRYLRDCLHPARHPDVVRARRKGPNALETLRGSPSLDAFVEALGKRG